MNSPKNCALFNPDFLRKLGHFVVLLFALFSPLVCGDDLSGGGRDVLSNEAVKQATQEINRIIQRQKDLGKKVDEEQKKEEAAKKRIKELETILENSKDGNSAERAGWTFELKEARAQRDAAKKALHESYPEAGDREQAGLLKKLEQTEAQNTAAWKNFGELNKAHAATQVTSSGSGEATPPATLTESGDSSSAPAAGSPGAEEAATSFSSEGGDPEFVNEKLLEKAEPLQSREASDSSGQQDTSTREAPDQPVPTKSNYDEEIERLDRVIKENEANAAHYPKGNSDEFLGDSYREAARKADQLKKGLSTPEVESAEVAKLRQTIESHGEEPVSESLKKELNVKEGKFKQLAAARKDYLDALAGENTGATLPNSVAKDRYLEATNKQRQEAESTLIRDVPTRPRAEQVAASDNLDRLARGNPSQDPNAFQQAIKEVGVSKAKNASHGNVSPEYFPAPRGARIAQGDDGKMYVLAGDKLLTEGGQEVGENVGYNDNIGRTVFRDKAGKYFTYDTWNESQNKQDSVMTSRIRPSLASTIDGSGLYQRWFNPETGKWQKSIPSTYK